MLILKEDSWLCGLRMYNKNGIVIFSTGNLIEKEDYRTGSIYKLVSFELKPGERIIGIRANDI